MAGMQESASAAVKLKRPRQKKASALPTLADAASLQGDLFAFLDNVDSPLIGNVKGERTMMVWSFFALDIRNRVTELPIYDDGTTRIEVVSNKFGVANMLDKDVLIYLLSLIQDRMNRGETPSPIVSFKAADFIRMAKRNTSTKTYKWLEGSLDRLKGTTIKTNIENGDGPIRQGETRSFGWIADYKFGYTSEGEEKRMTGVVVRISDWLFTLVTKNRKMLTYDSRYFDLGPLERRLYELARAHCGTQPYFRINIEKLRLRVGSEADLKEFKRMLKAIAESDRYPLFDYGFSIIDPKDVAARAVGTKPRSRTPIKAFQVLFFSRSASMVEMSTDLLNGRIAILDSAPDLEGEAA